MKKIFKKLESYKLFKWIYSVCKSIYYNIYIYYNKNNIKMLKKKLSIFTILNPYTTVIHLINSKVSMGRFGDGDISMTFVHNNGINDAEKHSYKLRKALIRVLKNNNKKFMIALPDELRSLKNYKKGPKRYWIKFLNKNISHFLPLLKSNQIYYNTSVTRPYMDYKNKKNSGLIFYLMRQIWKNKRVLIIEGSKSRVGIGDNLLNGVKSVKRIECPPINAFESYRKILNNSLKFLNNHNNFLTLISLGATATILSLDLCNHGFRAIDIGNIDLEYQWYLKGVNSKINLPYKYVLEVPGGNNVLPLPKNSMCNKEIISKI